MYFMLVQRLQATHYLEHSMFEVDLWHWLKHLPVLVMGMLGRVSLCCNICLGQSTDGWLIMVAHHAQVQSRGE